MTRVSRFENWSMAVSTKSWLIIADDIYYDVVHFRLLCIEYLTFILKKLSLVVFCCNFWTLQKKPHDYICSGYKNMNISKMCGFYWATLYNCLRLGHTYLTVYSYLLKDEDPSVCILCNSLLTVGHNYTDQLFSLYHSSKFLYSFSKISYIILRCDTIEEFNVDSKAEYLS